MLKKSVFHKKVESFAIVIKCLKKIEIEKQHCQHVTQLITKKRQIKRKNRIKKILASKSI